jgi:hypothetical protein
MSLHWVHVAAGYAMVLAAFLAMALGSALRHRAAGRRLAQLDPRAARRGGGAGEAAEA